MPLNCRYPSKLLKWCILCYVYFTTVKGKKRQKQGAERVICLWLEGELLDSFTSLGGIILLLFVQFCFARFSNKLPCHPPLQGCLLISVTGLKTQGGQGLGLSCSRLVVPSRTQNAGGAQETMLEERRAGEPCSRHMCCWKLPDGGSTVLRNSLHRWTLGLGPFPGVRDSLGQTMMEWFGGMVSVFHAINLQE